MFFSLLLNLLERVASIKFRSYHRLNIKHLSFCFYSLLASQLFESGSNVFNKISAQTDKKLQKNVALCQKLRAETISQSRPSIAASLRTQKRNMKLLFHDKSNPGVIRQQSPESFPADASHEFNSSHCPAGDCRQVLRQEVDNRDCNVEFACFQRTKPCRLTGDSKLSVGVNGCLSLCVRTGLICMVCS